MLVRVKICGITSLDDALAAVDCGADALGFMMYEPSKRFISEHDARRIIRQLPPFVSKTGVFVNAPAAKVLEVAQTCGFDTVQFHGDETPEYCSQFEWITVKAFRIENERSLDAVDRYHTTAWLFDSYTPGQLGGTGARFNWDLLTNHDFGGKPVILAGGLTPDNVAEAVNKVQPYAVDVSSGVEKSPGKKSRNRMLDFIQASKGLKPRL